MPEVRQVTGQRPPEYSALMLPSQIKEAIPSVFAVMCITVLLSSILHDTSFIIKAGINKKLNVICNGETGRWNRRAAFWFQAQGRGSLYMVQWVLKL